MPFDILLAYVFNLNVLVLYLFDLFYKMHRNYFFILLLFVSSLGAQSNAFKKQLDRIEELRQLSSNKELEFELRITYAKQAVVLSKKINIDSVFLKTNERLTSVYLEDPRYHKFAKKILDNNLKHSFNLKDSISTAYISSQLGYFYHINRLDNDSAYYYYYNAIKYLNNAPSHRTIQINILNNIAYLQEDELDYMGSQGTIIQAINFLLNSPKSQLNQELLSHAYILLGMNLRKLKEYDKALDYYQKALSLGVYTNKPYVTINIAEVYKDKGDYKKVFDIYDKLLRDTELKNKDANTYATILANYAFTLHLTKDKNTTNIDSLFITAHSIFEDLKLHYELSANSNDMSEFYESINEKDKSLLYAQKAYTLSQNARLYEEKLRALKQLSRLQKGDAGKAYLYEYIALSDSLISNERANRNKFARIQFETDQYINKTKRLSTQNILISIIAGIFILSLGLLYFLRLQKGKNQKLLFDQKQQEANEEIYGLLLKQQAKLEEGRMQERHRIAEDLHDGILSNLLGTRMNLGFLDLKGDIEAMEDYHRFLNEIQKIEKEIRLLSHELKGENLLTKTTFESVIDQYLKNQSFVGSFKYDIINKDILFDNVSDFTKVNIYRIIQEAVQNIIKHSKANHVLINFYLETEQLNLTIEDNGIGFDMESDKKGIGLKNIASRVQKLKGSFKITAIPNTKTLIHIIVPINF